MASNNEAWPRVRLLHGQPAAELRCWLYSIMSEQLSSNPNLERAKTLGAVGLLVSGMYGGHQFALVIAGAQSLSLEGILFLAPKTLVVLGAIVIFCSTKVAIWIYGLAMVISVVASIHSFVASGLPLPVFAMYHLPAFAFYLIMIFLVSRA